MLYGQMYTNYSSIISDTGTFAEERPNSIRSTGQEVVIPASGETQEDIAIASAVVKPGILYGGDLNILAPHDYLAPVFLALTVTGGPAHRLLAEKAQGRTIVHLRGNDIAQTCIAYPSVDEQRRIANLFMKMEQLIAAEKRKLNLLERKQKAYLQMIFMDAKKRGRFTGPWRTVRLGDIATRVTRRNLGQSNLPLTISARDGLIDQREYFNRQIASKNLDDYILLHQGEFAYNKSTSSDSPWGAIKQLDKYDQGCVSTLYICFSPHDINPQFLTALFDSPQWHSEIQTIATEGARNHGLLNVSASDFFDIRLQIPVSSSEQERIGKVFATFKELAQRISMKVKLLELKKESLLQQMFV